MRRLFSFDFQLRFWASACIFLALLSNSHAAKTRCKIELKKQSELVETLFQSLEGFRPKEYSIPALHAQDLSLGTDLYDGGIDSKVIQGKLGDQEVIIKLYKKSRLLENNPSIENQIRQTYFIQDSLFQLGRAPRPFGCLSESEIKKLDSHLVSRSFLCRPIQRSPERLRTFRELREASIQFKSPIRIRTVKS